MRTMLGALGLLAGLVLVAACGANAPGPQVEPPSREDSVSVAVRNHNYYDAAIYWVYDGQLRRRLGVVRSNQENAIFKVPWAPRTLAFEVDMIIAGGVYLSDPVTVGPGDFVELTVPANIATSGFFRRIGQ